MIPKLLLTLSLCLSLEHYTVTKGQDNGYLVAENETQYKLYFLQENVVGATASVGDRVTSISLNNEEHSLLWVLNRR